MELKAIGSEKRHIAGWQSVHCDVSSWRMSSQRPLTQNCKLTDGERLGVVFEGDHD
jgi:hypothetical protein